MTRQLLPLGVFAALLAATVSGEVTQDELAGEGFRKERDWTARDLSREPRGGHVLPVSNEIILHNSIDALQKNPGDRDLQQRTVDLACALARPQAPSPVAWQFLIDQGLLKNDMPLKEAYRLLGHPTYRKDNEVRWYFNFQGLHVFPGLIATEKDGKLKDWKVYRG